MTTEEKIAISKALLEYKNNTGEGIKTIAAKIKNISYGTIGYILNPERHNHVSAKNFRMVANWLKMDGWITVDTNNHATILELLWEAQEFSQFFCITGKSGYGKTTALDEYRFKNPNTYYVLADILMVGNSSFLMAIQRSMGLFKGRSASEMLNAIIDHLERLENPLLIIDDAGKLSDCNLRVIQLLYDRMPKRCGIAMVGTPYLKQNIEKGMKAGKMGFDELYRRVEHWQELYEPTPEEKLAVCEVNGVSIKTGVPQEIIGYISNTTKNFGDVTVQVTKAKRLLEKGKLSVNMLKQ